MSTNIEQLMAEILTELDNRGIRIQDWPADEAAAYRDNGGFLEGVEAVRKIRAAKAAARVQEAVDAARVSAFEDGVSEAQAMTGFTDETFRSVMDQCEYRPQD